MLQFDNQIFNIIRVSLLIYIVASIEMKFLRYFLILTLKKMFTSSDINHLQNLPSL
jgi:hypothetical protein